MELNESSLAELANWFFDANTPARAGVFANKGKPIFTTWLRYKKRLLAG
jgi:hypothetical protein